MSKERNKENKEKRKIINLNNPSDIRWLHNLLANRGARYVNLGRLKVSKLAIDRITPIELANLNNK